MRCIKLLSVGLFAFMFSSALSSSAVLELIHDPFSNLESKIEKPSRKTKRTAPLVVKKKWRPALHATIVAGQKSVVNVEGRVVRIGEKINGYTLIEVGRQTATFEKDQNLVTLKMTPKRIKK